MELDLGIHIVMHSVLSLKTGCDSAWRPGLPGLWLVTDEAARRWSRSQGAARLTARVRTHARQSWHPRATVWPCRAWGSGIPGPWHDAAVKGDGDPIGERRILGLATDGSSVARGISLAARGRRERQRCSPVGLADEAPDAVAGWCRRVGAVQGARLSRCRHSGAGLVKVVQRGGVVSLLAVLLLLLVWRRRKGKSNGGG
jgi:hypothetical protein